MKEEIRGFLKEGIVEFGVAGAVFFLTTTALITLALVAMFTWIWWPLVPIIVVVTTLVSMLVNWANGSG